MNETLKEREKLLSSRTKMKSHWSSGERKRGRFEHLTAAAQRREKEREREREKREREKREREKREEREQLAGESLLSLSSCGPPPPFYF